MHYAEAQRLFVVTWNRMATNTHYSPTPKEARSQSDFDGMTCTS
jgi:hypothetical protein